MANKEIQNNFEKKSPITILVVGILILSLVATFLILSINKKQPEIIQLKCEHDAEWLAENCKCLEWNGPKKCPANFELKGELCRNETLKTFTNVLMPCSKYDCPDILIENEPETSLD